LTPPVPVLWRTATVRDVVAETAHARTLVLDAPGWPGHRAGQHLDLRLTAEDGYQAQRSYSIASAPEAAALEITVEVIDDGEVSPYLVEEVRPGDELEVRGPIGGWFVWDAEFPALLLAGGFGVVPYVAMLRHARVLGREDLLRVAVSARTMAQLPYADELVRAGALIALTREAHGIRPAGRLTAPELLPLWERGRTAYVCGSASFAEAAGQLLTGMGVPAHDIRVERFGPSGGAV
jgi:ferredoxin-NADP reductase